MSLKSPFQCGGSAQRFPDNRVPKRLIIRIDDTDETAKVYVNINGIDPSATNAQYYLNAGESLEISGETVTTADKVRIIDASNDPKIFWSIE